MNRHRILWAAARAVPTAALGAALAGCTAYVPPPPDATMTVQKDPVTQLLVGVADQSGSFDRLIQDDGAAWLLLNKSIHQFYRSSTGETGRRLVVGQVSGSFKAPLFDAHPSQFGRIGGAAGFRSELRKNYAPGSRVWDSCTDVLGYATALVTPDTRVLVVLLTDFDDNASAPGAEERFVQALARLNRSCTLSVGAYFVDVPRLGQVQSACLRAGVRPDRLVVESSIRADPPLPVVDP